MRTFGNDESWDGFPTVGSALRHVGRIRRAGRYFSHHKHIIAHFCGVVNGQGWDSPGREAFALPGPLLTLGLPTLLLGLQAGEVALGL